MPRAWGTAYNFERQPLQMFRFRWTEPPKYLSVFQRGHRGTLPRAEGSDLSISLCKANVPVVLGSCAIGTEDYRTPSQAGGRLDSDGAASDSFRRARPFFLDKSQTLGPKHTNGTFGTRCLDGKKTD